jgi:phytoene synthase
MDDLQEELPEVSRIAFASTGRNRDPWLAALALDGRIGRMVLGASEPMLGQVRLAWWRDQLGKPIDDRPRGDPLLDLIGQCWHGREAALLALVDGWEALLGDRPLAEADMMRFVAGRGDLARGLVDLLSHPDHALEAARAGELWALADLAIHAQGEDERSYALEQGAHRANRPLSLPRTTRPLAVIGGLARRSLRADGAAMLGDRFSPLVALRLGMVGR